MWRGAVFQRPHPRPETSGPAAHGCQEASTSNFKRHTIPNHCSLGECVLNELRVGCSSDLNHRVIALPPRRSPSSGCAYLLEALVPNINHRMSFRRGPRPADCQPRRMATTFSPDSFAEAARLPRIDCQNLGDEDCTCRAGGRIQRFSASRLRISQAGHSLEIHQDHQYASLVI